MKKSTKQKLNMEIPVTSLHKIKLKTNKLQKTELNVHHVKPEIVSK